MLLAGIPQSSYTFTSVIKACASLSACKFGRAIHSHVLVSGYDSDPFVQAALVSFYAKSSELIIARNVFDRMRNRTIVAWNSMISGYEQNGFSNEAVEFFYHMQSLGIEPDSATLVIILSACSQLGALSLGCSVHDYIIKKGFEINVALGTSLINMYCRCGNVIKAREVFDQMLELNVIAWTAMICGYGSNGYGLEAVDLFNQMINKGTPPNNITFVAILSACAHSGLVSEGRRIFSSMHTDFSLGPRVEHHVCMVDMLGRAGLLNDAYQYIKELIPDEERSPSVLTAMLGACKMHKNFDLGAEVAEHLLAVEPENPGHYVLLSNIYALAGRMDRVEMIRNLMIKRKLKKQVGYSTIEIDQKTHLFSMGDKSHKESRQIYGYLDDLMCRIREAGYVPVPGLVMHQLEEEETEYALRYHSEKLAIAFGLLKTGPMVSIRVVKNLRMCEDCHSAIKFISVVADREIIVRDKLRFHHFKSGVCSCGDYW